MRAKVLQQWLLFPERFDPNCGARLSRTLDESKRRAILDAAALAWLPMELDIEVVDLVAEIMGPKRFSALARAFFLDIMPKPPLGKLLELGTKLMGLSPASFVKWWSKGWEAVYRDCGTVVGTAGAEGRGRIVYTQMPRLCLASEAFVESILCAMYGIYTLSGTTGVVRIAESRLDDGYLELELEWRSRRSSLARSLLRL